MSGQTHPPFLGQSPRWETAATEAITNPRAVTQHGLQLAAADIALLCAATSAAIRHAESTQDTPRDPAASHPLTEAGRAWRQAARWPSHLRLGGRSTQLRHASADLRRSLDEALRTGADWKPAEALFADTSPEHLLTVLHSGLQSAMRVGKHVTTALGQLTTGASRVWLDTSHIPMPRHSVQKALDSLRWDWLPDPAGYHSAEALHQNATSAQWRLVQAVPATMEVLALRPSPPARNSLDEGPWETVPVPTEPLRAAQHRERLSLVPLADPPSRAIGC